jgi:hypothetical protein
MRSARFALGTITDGGNPCMTWLVLAYPKLLASLDEGQQTHAKKVYLRNHSSSGLTLNIFLQ